MSKSIRRSRARTGLVALACLVSCLALASIAHAQSQFVGKVSDSTGAVLPGVTIEAASPVLIERVKSAVSDGQGRYTIIDLRPGPYTVTFKLTGFTTIVRDQITLPADFSMTLDAELKVGDISESITVSGDAPIVDVTQAQRTQVMQREEIDALPLGRSLQARAALVPGVVASLDVGGSNGMDQANLRLAGTEDNEATVLVDGMLLNSNSLDGASQYYFNDAMTQELSVQTSGVDAETSGGGVRINMIPKEGGNRVRGQFYYEGANGDMMSSNLTDKLRSQGVTAVNAMDRAYDLNFSVGGPIKKDRLWFFFTGHRRKFDNIVLGSFYPDGSPGVDDQLIHGLQLRLTTQLHPKLKMSAFYDDNNKVNYHSHSAGWDVATASETRGKGRPRGPRYAAQVKFTSTLSTRLMAEGGWGTNRVDYINKAQDGLRFDRPAGVRTCVVTPCLSFDPIQVGPNINPWFVSISHADPEAKVTRWFNAQNDFGKVPQRYVVTSKLTYVTGSHNLKLGFQDSYGPENWWRRQNGDIVSQDYRAGVPDSVVVRNSPVSSSSQVNYDIGVFAQDSWKFSRLALSPGVRLEWFASQVNEQEAAAGRFVAARKFDAFDIQPHWFDISPRLGLAYDLFGDSKTAVKFDVGKYVHNLTLGLVDAYNPMFAFTDRRLWGDCYRDVNGGLACSGANPYATNGDGVVQDWEIGPSSVSNFGSRIVNRLDPDIKRQYYIRTGVTVDHQLASNIGVYGGWMRTDLKNLTTTRNLLRSLADYTAFQIANPLDGYTTEKITVYNLNREKLSAVDNVDTNATTARKVTYNGFVFGAKARIAKASVFGGVTIERTLDVNCDSPDNPNTFRFCDTSGGSGEADALASMRNAGPASGKEPKLPYLVRIQSGANAQLPFGVQVSGAFRSYPGDERSVTYSVPAAAFTAAGLTRTQTVTVRLNPPGSLYYDRLNVVDLGVGKWFDLPGTMRLKLTANLYNLTNPDTVTARNNTFGAALGTINEVILARFWKGSLQVEW